MFRKNFWKVICPVFLLNCSSNEIYASELDESAFSQYLSQHATKLPSTQVQFGSTQSPTSHTVKKTVSISFAFDSPDTLMASELWRVDSHLKGLFTERYNGLLASSWKHIPSGPEAGVFFLVLVFLKQEKRVLCNIVGESMKKKY